jgi:hypothetical protein
MGSGLKSKGGIDMGNYHASIKEVEACRWCIQNNIFISPKANSSTEWSLVITINDKDNISPKSYKKIEIWKEMYNFYIYYYDKYNNIKQEKPNKEKPIKRQQTENSADNLKLF